MHIREIDVTNYRAISHRHYSFLGADGKIKPITVFAGPNGCGKSSLLYAMVQALRGTMGVRVPEIPEANEKDVHRTEPSGKHRITAEVRLSISFETKEMEEIRGVIAAANASRDQPLTLPPLPQATLEASWSFPPDFNSTGAEHHLKTQPYGGYLWLMGAKYGPRAKRERLLNGGGIAEIGHLRVFPQGRDPRFGLEDDAETASPDGLLLGDGEMAKRTRQEQTLPLVLKRFGEWATGKGLDAADPRRELEVKLQQAFSTICSPKEYLGYYWDHVRYGETPLLKEGATEYPYSLAASGEHVILQYLARLMNPQPANNSVILIDEPELHLHPRWIRQLYRALPKMGKNNQFIMTTHSPELRQIAAENNELLDLGALVETAQAPHAG